MRFEIGAFDGVTRPWYGSNLLVGAVFVGMVFVCLDIAAVEAAHSSTNTVAYLKKLQTPFGLANFAEAMLWLAIGTGFLIARYRQPVAKMKCTFAAVAFAAFGISDLIEIHTGAWWKPWPLLALKAICVAVFLVLLAWHYRGRREPHQSTHIQC